MSDLDDDGNQKNTANSANGDEATYAQVPADYPYSEPAGAGSGLESKTGKRSHMSEVDIIAQYYERAIAGKGRYGTEA